MTSILDEIEARNNAIKNKYINEIKEITKILPNKKTINNTVEIQKVSICNRHDEIIVYPNGQQPTQKRYTFLAHESY